MDGVLTRWPNRLGGLAYILRTASGDAYYGAHLREYVAANGPIRVGQVIGRVGESGDAYGTIPHLHFEWWPHGGPAADPMPLLKATCQDIRV